MEKILEDYIKKTGAQGASFISNTDKYGDVWEVRYGSTGSDGLIEPTGLPVLVFLRNEKVNLVPEDEAFKLLASLGEED